MLHRLRTKLTLKRASSPLLVLLMVINRVYFRWTQREWANQPSKSSRRATNLLQITNKSQSSQPMARLRRKATRRTYRIREAIHSRAQIKVDLAANRIKRVKDQAIHNTRRSKTKATNISSHLFRIRSNLSWNRWHHRWHRLRNSTQPTEEAQAWLQYKAKRSSLCSQTRCLRAVCNRSRRSPKSKFSFPPQALAMSRSNPRIKENPIQPCRTHNNSPHLSRTTTTVWASNSSNLNSNFLSQSSRSRSDCNSNPRNNNQTQAAMRQLAV